MTDNATYWEQYYQLLKITENSWLDSSNSRTQNQYFSVSLEAAGDVAGHTCLDIGCGHGQLASAIRAFGARAVTACDLMPALIEANRVRHAEIDWRHGDLSDGAFIASLPKSERVFVVEILQCLDAFQVLPRLWDLVLPGGRLVGTVCNRHCPIVQRTMARFDGHYQALDERSLREFSQSLPGIELCAIRQLTFNVDQKVLPYRVGPWNAPIEEEPPPNRLNFVLLKQLTPNDC